jgi:hypothetical protein
MKVIGIGVGVTGNVANSYIQYTLRKFMNLCFRHSKLLEFRAESDSITRGDIHIIGRGVKEPYNLIAHIIGSDNRGRWPADKDAHVCGTFHCTGGGSD